MGAHSRIFEDLDRMDAEAWIAHLAPDVVMQFANQDPVYGRDTCREKAQALFHGMHGISHHVIARWEHGDATIAETLVTFTRRDDIEVRVPMVTIHRTGPEGLITDYRVYLDPSPLWP